MCLGYSCKHGNILFDRAGLDLLSKPPNKVREFIDSIVHLYNTCIQSIKPVCSYCQNIGCDISVFVLKTVYIVFVKT